MGQVKRGHFAPGEPLDNCQQAAPEHDADPGGDEEAPDEATRFELVQVALRLQLFEPDIFIKSVRHEVSAGEGAMLA